MLTANFADRGFAARRYFWDGTHPRARADARVARLGDELRLHPAAAEERRRSTGAGDAALAVEGSFPEGSCRLAEEARALIHLSGGTTLRVQQTVEEVISRASNTAFVAVDAEQGHIQVNREHILYCEPIVDDARTKRPKPSS
jgi:hypothetical protein